MAIPGLDRLSRPMARAVEQALINPYGMGAGKLLNAANSVGKANPLLGDAGMWSGVTRGGRRLTRTSRIGDVIEIPTARGLAYAQVTHKMPVYRHLIRVVEGVWRSRPQTLDGSLTRRRDFSRSFPLPLL